MVRNLLARIRKDEEGATAIEYGLLAALIAVVMIAGATTLGGALKDRFNTIGGEITSVGTTTTTTD